MVLPRLGSGPLRGMRVDCLEDVLSQYLTSIHCRKFGMVVSPGIGSATLRCAKARDTAQPRAHAREAMLKFVW
jgi:hypothetical protein